MLSFRQRLAIAHLACGLTEVGENYADELVTKAADAPGARWHFLGAVQRNKVRRLAPVGRRRHQ